MIKYEDECVGCPREMGCLGNSCPYMNVPHYHCDKCEEETTLYEYDGEQLCKDCLLKKFDIVEGSDSYDF